STGNGGGAFCFLGFLVVIASVMEHPFRYYFMTPLYTEILTGSYIASFNLSIQAATDPSCHSYCWLQHSFWCWTMECQ
ncbi:hypothetical protein, partial [Noviherbaspirillum malthae]|uniref:hypothetical protein n=1 Tax=Noviherbaspirillum malthae TaxID=1260987 RepID=UPI001E461F6A